MSDLGILSEELIRLGKPNEQHMDLTAEGLDILDGENNSLASFTDDESRIGRRDSSHTRITSNGLGIFANATRKLAEFTSAVVRFFSTDGAATTTIGTGAVPYTAFDGMAEENVNGLITDGAVAAYTLKADGIAAAPVLIAQITEGHSQSSMFNGVAIHASKEGNDVRGRVSLKAAATCTYIDYRGHYSEYPIYPRNVQIDINDDNLTISFISTETYTEQGKKPYLRLDKNGNLTSGLMNINS